MDNGSPWGSSDAEQRHTWLSVWLIELGVAVSHGRPHHPQTQGKDERFHRTLVAEVIGRRLCRSGRVPASV
jgi:transposase InsO family protein